MRNERTYEMVLSGGLGVADVIFEPGGGEGGRPPRTRSYLMSRTRKVARSRGGTSRGASATSTRTEKEASRGRAGGGDARVRVGLAPDRPQLA